MCQEIDSAFKRLKSFDEAALFGAAAKSLGMPPADSLRASENIARISLKVLQIPQVRIDSKFAQLLPDVAIRCTVRVEPGCVTILDLC